MNFKFAIVLAAFVLSGPCEAAERWTPDTDSCNQQNDTYAIAACINERAKVWDQRLDQAYQAVLGMLKDDRARTDSLKLAQRTWLQYRNANCAFYETEQGTIRMIDVAACNRDLTQTRAIELQAAGPQ